jgi:predicted permease
MLTESLALSVAGGGAGVVVANWSLALMASLSLPGDVEIAAFDPSLDLRVLSFALVLSVATGVLFGLLPALKATRVSVASALKDEQAAARRRAPLPGALIAAQVAFCLVLLASGGLLARSLKNALATDLGFEPRGVALASVHLGLARYDGARAWTFAAAAARAAESLPGAKSAAWTGLLPLSGGQDVESLELPGAPAGQRLSVAVTAAGPGYFRTLRLPLSAGREFEDSDTPEGNPVVVVNEAAARRFWPGRDPIGQRIRIYNAERTVVGVSRDSRFDNFRDPHVPLVTLAIQQLGGDGVLAPMTLLVRVSGDPRGAAAAVRAEIAAMDASLPVFGPSTLEESIGGLLLPQRVGSALVGLFALLTLALSALGIYAVVAGSVARRVREIGIRLALGARPGQLRRMILAQSAAPVAAGLLVGLPLAYAAARALSSFLFGVTAADAATFLAAALVLALAAAAAADLPARRATRIDPMAAVRHE